MNALLTLKVLNANETGTTATERYWIIEKTAKLWKQVTLGGRTWGDP